MLHRIGWYLSIFFGLFFSGIGIPPVPEEVAIASAAAVTSAQELHWWFALPAVCLGIMGADTVLYCIGRRWGHKLFRYRWVERIIKAKRRERIEREFHNHGLKILMTARLLPPLRTGVFMIAGAVKYPFLLFLLADGVYAVVGVPLFFFASHGIIDFLKAHHDWAVYVLAAVVAVFVLYHYYSHLRAREERGTAEPPESVLEMPPAPQPADAAPPAGEPTGDRQEAVRPS